eukprot:scpid15979/ scgid20678/ AN1-type zinc finger protein 4; AN1-type zinc finger and ubiquitin domain-containing protein-like 1
MDDLYHPTLAGINLVVKTLVGTQFVVEGILPCDTVRTLKMTIQDSHGLRYSTQNLLYGRQQLDDDDKELQEYGIRDSGAVLTLVVTLRGGPLNARRAASASSIEPDTEIVLELLDGTDVVGAITLDEEIFDLIPGTDGKPFFVYVQDDVAMDMQRLAYMDIDDFYGHLAADSADSPLFGDGEGDNPSCSSPMCSSRPRTRSYSGLKLRRDQEEREEMEVKVERLRANMSHVKKLKQIHSNMGSSIKHSTATATTGEADDSGHVYIHSPTHSDSLSPHGVLSDTQSPLTGRNSCEDAPTRAQGPTPLRASYGAGTGSSLDHHVDPASTVAAANHSAGAHCVTAAACTTARRHSLMSPLSMPAGGPSPSNPAAASTAAAAATARRTQQHSATHERRPPWESSSGSAQDYWRGSTIDHYVASSNAANPEHKAMRGVARTTEQKPGNRTAAAATAAACSNPSRHLSNLLQSKKTSKATGGGTLTDIAEWERVSHQAPAAARESRIPCSMRQNPPPPSSACKRVHHSKLTQEHSEAMPPPPTQLLPSESSWHPAPVPPSMLARTAPHKHRSTALPGAARAAKDKTDTRLIQADHTPLSLPPIHPSLAGQVTASSSSVTKLPKVDIIQAKTKDGRPPRQRCSQCGKKLTLAGTFSCRCGQLLCTKHRNPECHPCTFDYKTQGRRELKQANPRVAAIKLPKI